MKLILQRKYFKPGYTIGALYLDGEYFCDTLEDVFRDLSKEAKVPGKTAIPPGVYKVVISFSLRFNQDLPELLDVPFFTGIRIHPGNLARDTEGCILVGENKIKGTLLNSRNTLARLMESLGECRDCTIAVYI